MLPLSSLHRGYKRGILNVIYINATSCTTMNRRNRDKFSLQFRIKVLKIKASFPAISSWGPPVQFSFVLLSRIEKTNIIWKILISFFRVSMQWLQPYRRIIIVLEVTRMEISTSKLYVLTYLLLYESTKIIPFVRLSDSR